MNNRAESTLMIIVEVIVVIIIVSLTTGIASSYAKGAAITAATTTEDMALMVETLFAIPGDALVEYPLNTSSAYTLVLDNQQVILWSKSNTEVKEARKIYPPAGYSVLGSVEEKPRICLEKKQNTITLRECP